MTVKELIKELKKLPQKEKVLIYGSIEDEGEGWIIAEESSEEVTNFKQL